MRMTRLAVLIPLLFTPLAAASPIIIDGGTTNVSTATNADYIVQNATLNILPGAQISSAGTSTDPNGASITMNGGWVGNGITVENGNSSLSISGGVVLGNFNLQALGDALTVSSTAQITGGVFIGGNSSGQAGSGVSGSAGTAYSWVGSNLVGTTFLSTLKISGGTFIGGTGSGGYYGGSTGYSLLSLGNTTVTGGTFMSPIAINGAYGGETDFLGSHLTYKNNILSGLLENGNPIDVRVYLDSAIGAVNASGTEVSFLETSSTTPLPSPIPEPTSALVFGLLATLVLARRRGYRPGSL